MARSPLGVVLGLGSLAFALQFGIAGGTRASAGFSATAARSWTAADLVGWYEFKYADGVFDICLRPQGNFHCPLYPAMAKWELEGDVVNIDWGQYGKYLMKVNADRSIEGHAANNAQSWRTAAFKRPLSPEEIALIGNGYGTEWAFSWEFGDFPVQFKADGFNHFSCQDYPAHAHWSQSGKKVGINWGDYGDYELVLNAEDGTMAGGAVGGDWVKEWRKARFIRNLAADSGSSCCGHHH